VSERVVYVPDTLKEPDSATSTTRLGVLANERHLPTEFLTDHVRVAADDEERPGWWAFDYPNLTGIWQTRYRNPDPDAARSDRWRSQRSAGKRLYNPRLVGPNVSEVWLCEGEIDTLTLVYLGCNAVGIPGVDEGGKSFAKHWKLLFDTAFVIVAFDGDDVGQAAAVKAARTFDPDSAILTPPDGMDISEWWVADPEGLQDAIESIRKDCGLE
jgi:hypothetical protein